MERLEYYLKYFTGCKNVLDIGCGSGIFLELMAKKGIRAEGVDISREVVKSCKKKGLKVISGNAIAFLKKKKKIYDGILISDVIEHLQPNEAKQLIKNCYSALKPSGKIVIITCDPKDIKDVLNGFWTDITHVRYYPLVVMKKLLESAGFKDIERSFRELLGKVRDLYYRKKVIRSWFHRRWTDHP